MNDYPKVIHVGGITQTVVDAKDEARWRHSEVPVMAPVPPYAPDAIETDTSAPVHEAAPVTHTHHKHK